MIPSVVFACLWVLAATIVAFLPMRRQFAPGLVLLIAAPVLIVWLAADFNIWIGFAAAFAFVSMFRKPLHYLAKRAIEKVAPDREGRRP